MLTRRAWTNENFQFACGVDHVTSSFIQIWNRKVEGCGAATLVVDNGGVSKGLGYEELPEAIRDLVIETEKRFEIARSRGNYHPNLDSETACRFARLCGFNVDQEIYKEFD